MLDKILKEPWSFSRLTTYEQCPYLWKNRYILNATTIPTEAQAIGHEVECWLDAFLTGELVSGQKVEPSIADTRLVMSAIDAFRELKGNLIAKQRHLKIDIEYEDGLTIPFQGYADYVFDMGSHLEVYDLKTCKNYSTWTPSRVSKHGQVFFYGKIIEALDKRDTKAYYMAVNRKDFRSKKLSASDAHIEDRLYKAYNRVKDEIFDCKKSFLCPYCDLYLTCPETRVQ